MNTCLNVPYNVASASVPWELVCSFRMNWISDEIPAAEPDVELPC